MRIRTRRLKRNLICEIFFLPWNWALPLRLLVLDSTSCILNVLCFEITVWLE